jgi:ABC-2 type transport system permease protein
LIAAKSGKEFMAIWTLYKRELSSYFQSAVGYVVLFGSAFIQGVFFVLLLKVVTENNIKDTNILQMFFTGLLFWIFLLGQVPLITMRLFSEEFKLGTIEMLLTAPVREWDVVLSKFFGAFTFFLVLWLPIMLDLFMVQVFSNPQPPVYWSQIGMTLLTLCLAGGFYVAIGLFSSVLTKNQIISAVLCFAFLLAIFFISLWKYVPHTDAGTLEVISYISGIEHMQNGTAGIFDTRPIVFYVSVTAFILMLTKSILEGRRLKG